MSGDPGFRWRRDRAGAVTRSHRRRTATLPRGDTAARFPAGIDGLDPDGQQHPIARLTGNQAQGTDKPARSQPRNA